jgi:histidine ammonia-lyase
MRAMVALAQAMAAARSPHQSWRAAAQGAQEALGGSFAALSVWERDLGTLRVLVNAGERVLGEEEFPEDESYPVHQFPEIAEFLHEKWAGGGGANAWVETAAGPTAGDSGYCHQRVAALRRRGRGCCVVAPIILHGRAWGELYVARPVGAPLYDAEDADFGAVIASVVAAGIAQTERLEEVRRLAFTDPLTGLANRRAVDMRLDEAIARHRADGSVVSLVVCDVNGLKKVNDTHGHAVGDRLLERFSTVLSLCGAKLPGALVARLGGDEFCLLTVGPSADEVIVVADELCVRAGELDLGDGVACGVASTADSIGQVRSARRLFRLADAAQYRAKAARSAGPVVAGRAARGGLRWARAAALPGHEAAAATGGGRVTSRITARDRRPAAKTSAGAARWRSVAPRAVTRSVSVRTLLNMDMHTVVVGTSQATAEDVVAVARRGARIELAPEAVAALAAAREVVDALAAKPEPVYGVSTGFGALATRHIGQDLRARLQRNIVRSHAAGMGPRVEREVVRALMFLRLKTLASGHTGVRPEVAQTMADVLNAGITPVVHEFGSLGCSGDLAPLSHCALTLIGEGDAEGPDGVVRPAAELLAAHGIAPVELREKEGLALLNGTDGMLGMLILALADLDRLYTSADITAALTLEALLGSEKVLAPELHAIRPHPGQAASAGNMLRVLAGSGLTGHFQEDEAPRVQDAYSVRCAPQVAGAGRDTLGYARTVAERELASAIDNPVVLLDGPEGTEFGGGRVESNGNFHGAPVAYVLDFLAIAAADLGSIAERRTDRLLDKNRSHGLPPFLADDPGVDSGLMIAQYTQAALVSEMKRLAAPASVDSIPSSAMQEDHVSMGWSAARKLRTAVDDLARIVAVELYTATRALELRTARTGLAAAPASSAAVDALRAAGVEGAGPDRFLAPDLAGADAFVRDGGLVAAVEVVTGPLA